MARRRTEVPGAHSRPLLGAGVMAGEENEDLLAYSHMQYRQNLPSLLRKHPKEEDSLPSHIEIQKMKKEAQQMQNALAEAREDFRERMEVIAHRWKDLHAKEAQLKAYIETSEKTLKEKAGIQIHALKKARKEREKKMQKENELVRAEETLEALKNQLHKLSNKVQKFSIFKEYLEELVKVSQFEDIQELIGYYKTLVTMRKNQLQSQQVHKEMSQRGQMLLDQHMAEKGAEIQQHENELKQLHLRFNQAQKDVLQWETVLADIQDTTTKKHLELVTIKMTILNLFQCLWLKADLKVAKDDSLRQLDMIHQFIQDFTDFSLEEKEKDR